jgi:hypothetical protein
MDTDSEFESIRQASRVFISHASKNFAVADEIRRRLEALNVPCWIAPRDVPPGASYGEEIVSAIQNCLAVVFVLSDEANKSKAVANELELAFRYQRVIIPVRFKLVEPASSLAFFINNTQWVDIRDTPLRQRVHEIARLLDAVRYGHLPPAPRPENKTLFGSLERSIEGVFRYKYLSLTIVLTLIIGSGLVGMLQSGRTLTDLGEVRNDTTSIREQLSVIEARQQEAETARSDSFDATMDQFQQIVSNVRALSNQSGLVADPSNYAEHYHNARILAQRGEVDLALVSYRVVIESSIKLADPIMDITTLLLRNYGRSGAVKYLEENLKDGMSAISYVYAQQLLATDALVDVIELFRNDPEEFNSFPPLGALFLEKLSREDWYQDSFSWSAWTELFSIFDAVKGSVISGAYLGYFIDQIRGSDNLLAFDIINKKFSDEEVEQTRLLSNHGEEAFRFTRRLVDISSSPVAIDYTYYSRQPNLGFPRGAWFSPHEKWDDRVGGVIFSRELGRFDILIWDWGIDRELPLEICAQSSGVENCIDFTSQEYVCRVSMYEEGTNCLRSSPDFGTDPAAARIHLNPQEIFGTECLSRVRYTDEDGVLVDITQRNIIATYRGERDDELLTHMSGCAYSVQIDTEVDTNQYF